MKVCECTAVKMELTNRVFHLLSFYVLSCPTKFKIHLSVINVYSFRAIDLNASRTRVVYETVSMCNKQCIQ